MGVVAISGSIGSLDIEIGRAVASQLGWGFADREIITKTAERFGADVPTLTHATEERPTLLERFTDTQRRFMAYVEATILEMAARDNVVVVGRAATVVLARAPHTLRVRISAPESHRAQRVAQDQGLTLEAAEDQVRASDSERGSRVRFLYHVDWNDPMLYDLVLNTERLSVEHGTRLVRQALEPDRFQSTEDSRRALADLSLAGQARAVLLSNPVTRAKPITVACTDGVLALGGRVEEWPVRRAAEQALAGLAGLREVVFLSPAAIDGEEVEEGPSRHGEARRWGGYGDAP